MVLMCGTKFVLVTLVYDGYRYRAQISVIVNYLNDTTVGQYWSIGSVIWPILNFGSP